MHHYTPYYCEENVWHLCDELRRPGVERRVVFISNPSKQCALWHQRAAHAPGEPVLWDYHVILFARDEAWRVWDLDTLLGMPVDLRTYLVRTFEEQRVPARFMPLFRVLDGDEYLELFSSDRAHMRNEDGSWKQPPPAWTAIHRPGRPSFMKLVDMTGEAPGVVMGLDQLRKNFDVG